MSTTPNDSNLVLDTDKQGWYKLIIPNITEVFSTLWTGSETPGIELLPFIYGKLEQAAFDLTLSHSLYAIDKVCLVQIDRTPKPGSKVIPVIVIGLAAISSEQEGRCYLPTTMISCIIPIKPEHILVTTLVTATTESLLIAPTTQETGTILNLPGKAADK